MPELLVVVPFAAKIGGVESYFGDLCAALPRHGWEVNGLAMPAAAGRNRERPSCWDRVIVVGKPWWAVRDFAAATRAEIVRRKPDVVLTYAYEAPLVCGPNVPPGPRVVERMCGTEPSDMVRIRDWHRYFDGIIVISRGTEEVALKGLAEVPQDQRPPMRLIAGGSRLPSVAPPRPVRAGGPLRLIWFGRTEHRVKGVLDLIPIARSLQARGVPFVLTIMGEGPDRETLRHELATEIAAGCVQMLPAVAHEQVFDQLMNQDVFLSTSRHEGGPHTLIEAMSCNVVPVVTDIPGLCRDVVRDGQNGLRVPVGDIAAFTDRLARLAADRSLLQRLAEQCRPSVVPAYTSERLAVLTDAFLREVLAAPPRRRLDRAEQDLAAFLPDRRPWLPNRLRRGLRWSACKLGMLAETAA